MSIRVAALYVERDKLQGELDALLREAARLARYDLTLPNGRARAKYDALGPRERELRERLAEIETRLLDIPPARR